MIAHKNFMDLLSKNTSPSSEEDCLQCPIICTNPCQVIFLITRNNRYQIYDAKILIQWIKQSKSKIATHPYTRAPLTLEHIISAHNTCVFQHLEQEIKNIS